MPKSARRAAALVIGFGLLAAADLASGQENMTHPEVGRVMSSPRYQQAIAHIEQNHDRLIEENVTLQQIPAPYREEGRKAEAFAGMLTAHGLSDVGLDADGNVTGVRKGSGGGDMVAIVAHLDTVFPLDTDLTIERDGTRIKAPGIADNSRGQAAMLAMIRAMDAAGVEHESDILFVGSVGEEGLGDLRGVKHLLGGGQYKDRIRTFITFDGTEPKEVMNEALGSKRYQVTFKGPGGHSYRAFGSVNPMYAMADAMMRLSRFQVPEGTTYSAGVVGGGTSVNSIPTEAWVQVDMRSASPSDLGALEQEFLKVVQEAAAAENRARSTENGEITVDPKLVGDRPSGSVSPDAPIVRIAMASIAAHGWQPELVSRSTDANVPISLGIPTVTIASGLGDRTHSLDEFLDTEKSASVRQLGMALTTLLAAAGFKAG
jgi:tripeptide aminopeptidase